MWQNKQCMWSCAFILICFSRSTCIEGEDIRMDWSMKINTTLTKPQNNWASCSGHLKWYIEMHKTLKLKLHPAGIKWQSLSIDKADTRWRKETTYSSSRFDKIFFAAWSEGGK